MNYTSGPCSFFLCFSCSNGLTSGQGVLPTGVKIETTQQLLGIKKREIHGPRMEILDHMRGYSLTWPLHWPCGVGTTQIRRKSTIQSTSYSLFSPLFFSYTAAAPAAAEARNTTVNLLPQRRCFSGLDWALESFWNPWNAWKHGELDVPGPT